MLVNTLYLGTGTLGVALIQAHKGDRIEGGSWATHECSCTIPTWALKGLSYHYCIGFIVLAMVKTPHIAELYGVVKGPC